MTHFRYLTAGESHGPELTTIVEGIPAGFRLTAEDIGRQLARRQEGYGRGGRMAFEKDAAILTSGVRFGKTMGGPIAMRLLNRAYEKDDANWPVVMAPEGDGAGVERITIPRPGHADLVGTQKFGFDDIRPVIERSSARETGARVAAGAVARQFLRELGVRIGGHVIRLGGIGYTGWDAIRATADTLAAVHAEHLADAADRSDVRCLDPDLSAQMVDLIKVRRKEGTSLGGVYEIVVTGLPAGLGSYTHWDRKLDGQLAAVILGTQAMKGVEFGMGFETGERPGHEVHDEITWEDGRYGRRTNRAGGLEGGMTTGAPLLIRGVMKPIPTMLNPIRTVDIDTKQVVDTRYERSDVCALPRAVVVIENIIAPVLANALMDRFGGDTIEAIRRHWNG